MIIRQPNCTDWEIFSALASLENWRVPWSEFQRFKGPWSQFSHVIDDNGFCGFITAVVYEQSAWIGNLIVPNDLRRKGYGQYLFKSILTDLAGRGMTSIWLTASDQGRSLYEREGFVEVDRIERWVLPRSRKTMGSPLDGDNNIEKLLYADRLAWGENRESLLSDLCNGGEVFTVAGAVALLQTDPDIHILGPWYTYGASLHAHQDLLNKMIAASDPNIPIIVDLLSSSPLPALCDSAGFQLTGETSLMAYGDIGSIDLTGMVSLASLGSIG